jgi:hypothetical protein
MGNKNLIQLAGMIRGAQKLMLGSFPAVEQPHLSHCWLLQIQHYRRHITRTGRHASGCPQKSNSIVQCPQGVSQTKYKTSQSLIKEAADD